MFSPAPRRRLAAFTLVELLVVIGIIALLIAILLPALSKARGASTSVACKSLLRQYWMAGQMYANENNGWAVDQYKYLDHSAGLLKYFGVERMNEKLARCPGDNDAGLAELGLYQHPSIPVTTFDYRPFDKNGLRYSVKATIGLNNNVFGQGGRTSTAGVLTPRYIKPYKLRNAVGRTNADPAMGYDPTKVMVWGDYQNNPNVDQPDVPMIKPTALDNIGSITFRHGMSMNAAFLDGHVGTIKPKLLRLRAGGTQFESGEIWGQWTDPTQPKYYSKSMPNHYYLFYPFGPGREGSTIRMLGDMPVMQID